MPEAPNPQSEENGRSAELKIYERLEPRILEAKISYPLKDEVPVFIEKLVARLPEDAATELKRALSTKSVPLESITAIVADPTDLNKKFMATYYFHECATRFGLRKKGDLEITPGHWAKEEVPHVTAVAHWGPWRGILTSSNTGAWIKSPDSPEDQAKIARWQAQSKPQVFQIQHPLDPDRILPQAALAFDQAFPLLDVEPQTIEFIHWTAHIEPPEAVEIGGGLKIRLPNRPVTKLEWVPSPAQ